MQLVHRLGAREPELFLSSDGWRPGTGRPLWVLVRCPLSSVSSPQALAPPPHTLTWTGATAHGAGDGLSVQSTGVCLRCSWIHPEELGFQGWNSVSSPENRWYVNPGGHQGRVQTGDGEDSIVRMGSRGTAEPPRSGLHWKSVGGEASMVCAKWSHGLRIGVAPAFCDVMVTWSPASSSVSRRGKPEGAGSGRGLESHRGTALSDCGDSEGRGAEVHFIPQGQSSPGTFSGGAEGDPDMAVASEAAASRPQGGLACPFTHRSGQAMFCPRPYPESLVRPPASGRAAGTWGHLYGLQPVCRSPHSI